MAAMKKWTPSKLLNSLTKWLDDPYNQQSLFGKSQQKLRDYVANNPPAPPISSVGIWLGSVATWYRNKGCVEAFKGLPDGLRDLALSASYAGWGHIAVSSHLASVTPKPSPRLLLNDECLILAMQLTLGMSEDADRLGARIIFGLEHEMYASDSSQRVAAFVLKLFCASRGMTYPERAMAKFAPAAEPYEHLLRDLWSAPDHVFKVHLHSACDFHVARSRPSTDDEDFEFDREAFQIFPVEILAALRARELHGLALPPLEHPLLNTPLGRLPPVSQPGAEPLLEAVVAKARGALLLS